MVLLFRYDLSFKVNLEVKGQTHENHQISPLLFRLELWDVLHTDRKVGSRNPLAVLLFPYDLSFKVNLGVKGQTYENHQISPLLFKLELWDVLHTNRKVGSRNPMVVLLFPYDPSFSVNLEVKGQTYENHQISPLLYKLELWDV